MRWTKNKILLLTISLILLLPTLAQAFIVRQIEVDGLQRVSRNTALTYIPARIGQNVGPPQSQAIIESLYKTGFFSNVTLFRRGSTLVVKVVERPTVGLVKITGNKAIKTKDLVKVLKQQGITEGNVYNSTNLAMVEQGLKSEYYNLGRYNAVVKTTVTPEARNRVAIQIHIIEGSVVKVGSIKVIGNQAYSEKKLLKQFKLSTPNLLSWLTKNDRYTRAKLDADIENLTSFYLNNGYLRFKVVSQQVSITPNAQAVYIVVNIHEGQVYKLSGYQVEGRLLGQKAAVEKLINLKVGETFSRKDIIAIEKKIHNFYADQGYAFTKVQVIPEINDRTHQVMIRFIVDPGQIIYIRHIVFAGNSKTNDTVLRREMRLMEGSRYSLSKILESKRRLANLGYLQNIEVKTVPVPDHANQVDLHVHVKEAYSASISAQLGYSDLYGFVYGANLTEKNFLGTGKAIALAFSASSYSKSLNFTYINPYFTQSGISHSLNVFAQTTNPNEVNLTDYSTSSAGFTSSYGIPMSEYNTLFLNYGYSYLKLNTTSSTSTQVNSFIAKHGRRFNIFTVGTSWQHSTYNRAIFPTKGFMQQISGTVGLPLTGDSLEYYTITYSNSVYAPLSHGFIFHASSNLGYGDGYGRFKNLPFFRNFYAGGIGSVRGYLGNDLGPLDSNGDALGGNILTTGSISMIFPNHISDKIRTSLFVDAGNVFQDRIDFGNLRYSVGLGVEWLTPIGPLQFSLAYPLDPRDSGQKEPFQFSIGTSL